MCAGRGLSRLLLYLVLPGCLWWLPSCWCQGLNPPPTGPTMGATSVTAAVLQQYKRSKAFRLAWKNSPTSACSMSSSASLCAHAGDESAELYAQLMLATSPAAYSSTNPSDTGGHRLVSAPQLQGPCDTCVAFTLASAAESAITSALVLNSVTQVSISVQSIYYCSDDTYRECDSGMTLLGALNEFLKRSSQLVTSDCLGYRPDPSSTATKGQMCSRSCDQVSPQLAMGKFEYKPITAAWKAQRHIREFGGVISKFQVFDDFRPFFDNYANAAKVYRPRPGAQFQFNHAVFVVGYDLEQEFFYVKNSWGPNWGEDGFFRVAFGCCGLLEEAYGLVFVPHQQPPAQLEVTVSSNNPECFLYKVRPGDYLSRIAALARIPLNKFMLDNANQVKDLDDVTQGKQLVLCKPAAGTFKLPSTAPKSSDDTKLNTPPGKPIPVPVQGSKGQSCANFEVECANTTIALAISYQVGSSHVTNGWWQLKPGPNKVCYPAEARPLKTISYYFTAVGFCPDTSILSFVDKVPYPGGNSSEKTLCVNVKEPFTIKDAHKVSCTGKNLKKVTFYHSKQLHDTRINQCPVCYFYHNKCKTDLYVGHTIYSGSFYFTWGWLPLPAEKDTLFCYYVPAEGDPGHVALHFSPEQGVPALTVNWPGTDYADGQFCTDDIKRFGYVDAHQMKCNGSQQVMGSFWRIQVPRGGFTVKHCNN